MRSTFGMTTVGPRMNIENFGNLQNMELGKVFPEVDEIREQDDATGRPIAPDRRTVACEAGVMRTCNRG